MSDIGNIIGGGTPSSSTSTYWNGDIPWISSSDLTIDNINDISITRYITPEALRNSSTKVCQPNTILIVSRVGVGKVAYTQEHLCTSQDFTNISNVKNCNIVFATYSVQKMMQQKAKETQGTSIKGIPMSEIKDSLILKPTTLEQQKVASLLSLIDERISTQMKIIEDLKVLKSAIGERLFTQDIDCKYRISEIAQISRGRVINAKEISQQKLGIYPVYSSQTSNNGIMGYLDTYDYDGEYVTWTTDGINAGTVFYRSCRFNCTNVCGLLKVNEYHNAYYVSCCLQKETRKYVSTNLANPKLMNNIMSNIELCLPKLERQNKIAKLLQVISEKIDTEHNVLIKHKDQKKFLLSQMFI